jgi:hypothetical protein
LKDKRHKDGNYLGDTEETDSHPVSSHPSFLRINLLEADVICRGIERPKRWAFPLLVLLRIALFEVVDILGHLLENLFLEYAFLRLS